MPFTLLRRSFPFLLAFTLNARGALLQRESPSHVAATVVDHSLVTSVAFLQADVSGVPAAPTKTSLPAVSVSTPATSSLSGVSTGVSEVSSQSIGSGGGGQSVGSGGGQSAGSGGVVQSIGSAPEPTTTSPAPGPTAIPACLKTVELSCLNLAANCVVSVTPETVNNLWSIKSCAAAATCYGVGDLISSVSCQTGLFITTVGQASLDYNNVYASIVGSCAFAPGGCPVTQQNYIDFYYGTLTAVNTANWPSSSSIVIAYWTAITTWAATGSNVPYLNLNDWYHFSG